MQFRGDWINVCTKLFICLIYFTGMVYFKNTVFGRMFTPPKRVMCHVSRVTCHVSRVTCHVSFFLLLFFFFWTKWWSLLVEGLLSTGPTPSSFHPYTWCCVRYWTLFKFIGPSKFRGINRPGVAGAVLQSPLSLIQ